MDENRSYGMQNDVFRVGVTRDVLRPDGSLVFAPVGLEALDAPGIEWDFLDEDRRELSPDQLGELDGLFHFSPIVSAASLEGVDRLALIARHGVGLDFIDLEACTGRGIAVTITPAGVTRPMASAAVALVLALSHRLLARERLLRAGHWSEGRFDLLGLGLTGRTLGVVGYGRIGREVVRLLRPWQMRVLVSQRSDPGDSGVEHVPLDILLEQADVVVLACPLTPETHHLLDAARLERMKTSALLVNVGRGPVVDQHALVEALAAGRLGGAGLDVFEQEPVGPADPVLGAPHVVAAPHALGYWDQLFRDCVGAACGALLDVAAGRVPADVANPAVLESPLFRAKLGRAGARLDLIRDAEGGRR
jgi:phosphoglycerate dehydrogenase-like enzyme